MFPVLRQRVMLFVAFLLALGAGWAVARGWLAADGSSGISLWTVGSPWFGVGVLGAGGLAGIFGLALLSGAVGHPLAAVVVFAGGLLGLALRGGSIDGYLFRSAFPAGSVWLVVECLVWAGLWVAALLGFERWRGSVRSRLPQRLRFTLRGDVGGMTLLAWPGATAWAAGLATAGAGGFLANLQLQVSATGQVVGALIGAFAVAALVVSLVVPQGHLLPLLLSPLLVGAVGHAATAWRYLDAADLWQAWFDGRLQGLSLALPLHFASAGVLGVALGWAVALAIDHARQGEREARVADRLGAKVGA